MANGDCNGFADKQEGLVQFRPRVREVARDEEVAFGVGVGVGSNDFGAMMDAHGSENWGYAGVGGGEGGVRWGSR